MGSQEKICFDCAQEDQESNSKSESSSSSTNCEDRILHKKCAVVKTIRRQIEELDERFAADIDSLKKKKCLKRVYIVLSLIFALLLLWLVFVYGAISGVKLCSNVRKTQKTTICNIMNIPLEISDTRIVKGVF